MKQKYDTKRKKICFLWVFAKWCILCLSECWFCSYCFTPHWFSILLKSGVEYPLLLMEWTPRGVNRLTCQSYCFLSSKLFCHPQLFISTRFPAIVASRFIISVLSVFGTKEGDGDRQGHKEKKTWVGVEGPEEEMRKEDEEERVEEIQVEGQRNRNTEKEKFCTS